MTNLNLITFIYKHFVIYNYVVVQFYPWFNFYFPLFFFMYTYNVCDNERETKENKKLNQA